MTVRIESFHAAELADNLHMPMNIKRAKSILLDVENIFHQFPEKIA